MGKTLLGCGFVLLSLVAVGCGDSGSDDDDDGGGGGAVPMSAFATRTAATLCKLVYQCCTTAQREANDFVGSTEAECKSNYGALFTLITPEINESISKKRIRYDGNAYGTCLARIEAEGCSTTTSDPLACENAITPLVPSGGACQQQAECIDSVCIGGDSDTDGACGAPLPNGADCFDHDECASGSCPALTCEAKVANGSACFEDEECTSDYCNPDTSTCEARTSEICQ